MALSNLRLYLLLKRLDSVPHRAPHPPNAHIITSDQVENLPVPREVTLQAPNFPTHLRLFKEGLSARVREIQAALDFNGDGAKFSNRIIQRGKKLHVGGNVLQVRVQQLQDDSWWVLLSVAASMKTFISCPRWESWRRPAPARMGKGPVAWDANREQMGAHNARSFFQEKLLCTWCRRAPPSLGVGF
jgi:hypothetical protein